MILRSLECKFLTIALCDAAEPWQLGSQDAATPMMQGIIDLHHDFFFFLILILVFVSRMLVRALWHFKQTNPIPQRIVRGTTIEIIWTIFPSVILLFIAIPSLKKWIWNLTSRVSFFLLGNPRLLFYINILFFGFLLVFRLIFPLLQLFSGLTSLNLFLVTLPPEAQSPQALAHLQGLNFYLSLYEQDPEWVAFIQQELNCNTPLGDIPGRLRLFLMEEKISCLRRDLFLDFIALYNGSEAVLPLEPYILEEAVRAYLDSVRGTDNFSILQAAYQDLRENGRESFFYLETVAHNQDALDAQSASKWCFEEARRIRWEGISSSQARLERAEHEHALLLFQYEDKKRGRI